MPRIMTKQQRNELTERRLPGELQYNAIEWIKESRKNRGEKNGQDEYLHHVEEKNGGEHKRSQ
jgi:hypothetical protein